MTHAAILETRDTARCNFAAASRAHLVGAAGAGMRSLGDVLAAAGWQLSGSDLVAADRAPFPVRLGHDAAAIDASLDVVIHSAAVPPTNPELLRARQLAIPTFSYAEMLGRLMPAHAGVAIAGTHGKSTTTAMAADIVAAAGLDPTVVVGAARIGHGGGGHYGHGRWMLAEACEYRGGFHALRPEIAAVLNVEPDHFDCFASPAELEAAFARFARAVPASGLVVARADCAATRRACAELACRRETFGWTPPATWWTNHLEGQGGYYAFELCCRDRAVCNVALQVPGRHNVLNAVAAAAVASHCGANAEAIRQGLTQFAGLERRIERLGEATPVALVDDYAHHPTEVAATLAALREMHPRRRLWCVFQPHQVSRLARLLDEFAHSLQNADKVIVADVYRARESHQVDQTATAARLGARVASLGGAVVPLSAMAEIRDHLAQALRPGDVLVTMGAGDIGKLAHELGQGLRTFRQAG